LNRSPNRYIPDESELEWRFVRSSGPGGQNVNKVATAVELRFDVARSRTLPEEIKSRLMRIAGRRVSAEGILIIDARRFRSQARNRDDALARLHALIDQAAHRPRQRLKTAPTQASRQRRLESKRRRAGIKSARGRVRDLD
jgi:ribosome-associated protein